MERAEAILAYSQTILDYQHVFNILGEVPPQISLYLSDRIAVHWSNLTQWERPTILFMLEQMSRIN